MGDAVVEEAAGFRAYGLKNPVAIIPNGVDLPEIGDQGSGVRGQGSGVRGQGTGRKILLFLGRIHPKKGLVNALRAWAEIRGQGTGDRSQEEWQFVIAGWDQGGHEAELKRLCDELGLAWGDGLSVIRDRLSGVFDGSDSHSSNSLQLPCSLAARSAISRSTDNQELITDNRAPVVFLGPAFGEAKDQLLRRASAFILPSFSEGLPMSVLEAWSYRLPVLMTDHCNLPEGFAADAAIRIGTGIRGQGSGNRGQGAGVGDQGTGDREQPLGIDEGMWALFEMSDADRDTMGRQGRALVESHFTWPQVAAQMKEVYEWLLGGGPRPGCVRD